MSWRESITLRLIDALAHTMRAIWVLVGIVLSLLALWIASHTALHTADYLSRTLFDNPWG